MFHIYRAVMTFIMQLKVVIFMFTYCHGKLQVIWMWSAFYNIIQPKGHK